MAEYDVNLSMMTFYLPICDEAEAAETLEKLWMGLCIETAVNQS